METLHIACDHAGLELKETLKTALAARGFNLVDHGTRSAESCDYPQYAHALCAAVEAENGRGILICGTGIGMSMAANRHAGIRAALCTTELHARLTRRHNNANVLCLGARVTGVELALAIMNAFLDTDFEGGRHQRRIDQLNPQPAR
ncbi:ribose 5-phosphate isomerase B [uncultured Desulfovibrio sp.]|uniref:Ribose 5-phosphate isomerase B n=1 Tax=Candidatus Desulfovibrio intestinavium TaxID=2838534 RepID=A0A9D2KQ06_9BACT|nr:ribose 5-phosphate isomerase B [uncultured Desulfovibrio sp.]HJA79287.1 ribose 5-phosphate isomerase B [Candidatus Desulfovibrio intestinavium]